VALAAGSKKKPAFQRAFLLSLACDQYKSSTAPLLALDALKANLACTPRV
jgi:hypothetical protein